MDAFDLISKVLGIISPIISIISVILTKKKASNESNINIAQKHNEILLYPTLTVNNYVNSENNSNRVKAKYSLQDKNDLDTADTSKGLLLILVAILFMLIAFVMLKKIKQFIIMFLLLEAVVSVIISLINITKKHELLEEKFVVPHLFFCVAGTVLPFLLNYQFYQPMTFNTFYDKLFPKNVEGLDNILSNMFVQSVKLHEPTDYYLSIFMGLILIAMYEFIALTYSIKFCRTKKVPQHKIVPGIFLFVISTLAVTGVAYQISFLIVAQINNFVSWVSSPSFHLS
jgi:hypothetical protein